MICERTIYKFCCEDPSLIENYYEAINDKEQTWHCHHKLEIQENKIYSAHELINLGLYWHRPAKELIFLTSHEHHKIHFSVINKGHKRHLGYKHSDESKKKMSIAHTGKRKLYKPAKKYKWLTTNNEIRLMDERNAKRYHPNWILIDK